MIMNPSTTSSFVTRARLALVAMLVLTVAPLHAQTAMMHDAKGAHADGVHALNTDATGLAVKGYDLVAYQTQNAAVAGTADFVATHQGATFRFVSAANRNAFVAEPARYLPQYGGYCAMGVAVGRKFDIDPAAFRVVEGKLYLNKNAATQRMWLRDVPGHITKADAQWPAVSMRSVER